MSENMRKGPKLVNRMKLKQPICDEHGELIDLTVGDIYDVTFQTVRLTDDDGNTIGELMVAHIGDYSSRFLPDEFSEFFEEVEENEETVQELPQ